MRRGDRPADRPFGGAWWRRHTGLIGYTVLNYFDKLLIFLTPLAVLYLYRDRLLYNEIEYVCSVAAVVVVPLEFGIANSFLFAYRGAEHRDALVERAHAAFLWSFALYVVVAALATGVAAFAGAAWTGIALLTVIRALFLYFIQFYGVYFRVVDRPANVFWFSCLTNVGTLAIVLALRGRVESLRLEWFFATQAVVPLAVAAYQLRVVPRARLLAVRAYVAAGVRYAWPISLNILLFMVVSNYGKVYARNWLTEGEMFQISFVQRLALIIQLAHASAVGYLAKAVFVEEGAGSERRLLATYTVMMAIATAGVWVAFAGVNAYSSSVRVALDGVTLSLVAYTIIWCYGAYFELYLNKINRNKTILAISIVSSALFGGILSVGFASPLARIGVAMAGSSLLKLILTVAALRGSRMYHVATDPTGDYRVPPVE